MFKHHDQVILQEHRTRAKQSASDSITSIAASDSTGNDVAEEILHTADKECVDTIVLDSRGTQASRDFHMGSMSYKVSLYAKRTLIILI
jgi:hypothetical protein